MLSWCVDESSIRENANGQAQFIVPGFYVGCYVIESSLQSTLECFYDQTCLSTIQSFGSSPIEMNVKALDSSLPSQYHVNSTIQDLINDLMVEQWNISEDHNNYYAECQPARCTYTYSARNDAIYIIVTLIGLLGGLITVLKIIVPLLVQSIRKRFRFARKRTGKVKHLILSCHDNAAVWSSRGSLIEEKQMHEHESSSQFFIGNDLISSTTE